MDDTQWEIEQIMLALDYHFVYNDRKASNEYWDIVLHLRERLDELNNRGSKGIDR